MFKIVSLGDTCSIAWQKIEHEYRDEYLPFDWIKTSKMSTINYLIGNQFNGFLDSLIFKGNSVKFPLDDQNDPLFIKNNKSPELSIYGNQYCTFYHDFTSNTLDSQLTLVREKYYRRIKRFYYLLNSSNYPILFVRNESNPNNITPSDVDNFINLINNINPSLNYQLTILLHNSKNKSYPLNDYHHEKVIIYNDYHPFIDWQWSNINWSTIFSYVL